MDNSELSFHDMEEMKRQQPVPALSDISGPSGPRPPPPPPPPPNASMIQQVMTEDEDNIQLRHIVSVLRRHTLFLLTVGIFFPVVVTLYTCILNLPEIPESLRFGATRQYAASVRVEQVRQFRAVELRMGGLPLQLESSKALNINLIMKREKFKKIYNDLLRQQVELYNNKVKTKVLAFIEGKHSISISSTDIEEERFTITANGTDPGILPFVGKVVVPALNSYSQSVRSETLQKLIKRLENAKHENDLKIDRTWKKVSSISREIDLATGAEAPPPDLNLDRIKKARYDLEWEIQNSSIELTYLSKKIHYLDLKKKFFIGTEADIRKVYLDNPLRRKWAQLDNERTQGLTHYKEAHPIIQRLSSDIASIMAKLEISGGTTSLGKVPPIPKPEELEALRDVESLNDRLQLKMLSLDEVKNQIRKLSGHTPVINKADEQLRTLENSREAFRAELDDLRTRSLRLGSRITELSIASGHLSTEDEFELISGGSGAVQISPRPKLDIPIAFVVGIVLACAIVFLREHIDEHLHSPSDIAYHLRLNFLGVIPRWNEKQPVVMDPDKPDLQISEIFAHLCNSIRYGPLDQPEKCLMIASAMQAEGKSTISANLAMRYAMEGNTVLLIDADMRHHKATGLMKPFHDLDSQSGGLSGYLSGEMQINDIVLPCAIPGLSIIAAGERAKNPARLLGSEKLVRLIRDVEKRFDIVIVDCPAVLPVVDATIIAPHMRGVLVVAAAEEVTISAAKMALYRLNHVGAPIVGAVLNKAQEHSSSYAYYGYRKGGVYSYGVYGTTENG